MDKELRKELDRIFKPWEPLKQIGWYRGERLYMHRSTKDRLAEEAIVAEERRYHRHQKFMKKIFGVSFTSDLHINLDFERWCKKAVCWLLRI